MCSAIIYLCIFTFIFFLSFNIPIIRSSKLNSKVQIKKLLLKYMKPTNVEVMKQNKIADNIVNISIPATVNDFCGSSTLSGKGQLSSQSMQLQGTV